MEEGKQIQKEKEMKKDIQILKALITEMQSGECCKECGGSMYEGMCMECGYMEEELKGGQKKLDVAEPFGKLTGADFKKLRSMKKEDDSVHGKEADDAIDRSELKMLKNIYKKTDPSKIPDRHAKRIKDLEAKLGVNENHEGTDHEVSMANNSLDSILWAANELKKYLGDQERDIPAWIQDHITNAENYIIQAAKNFHEYGSEEATEGEPIPDEMSLQEMVKKVGNKYNVYSKKGKKLGSHPSKKKAQKQMAAIEISKQGK